MARAFFDLFKLPEDDRIKLIARAAEGKVVGFVVDDDAKADRYIEKLKKLAPTIHIIDKNKGPAGIGILVRVTLTKES